MATLGEFLSPEAGQARRKWLNESLGQFIPPELRGWVGAGAELNPVTNMERAGAAAQRMTAPGQSGWDRMAAAGDMATNMGAVLAPVAAAKMAGPAGADAANAIVEALTAASPMRGAMQDFAADEFGGVGFRAYHGSPHDFDRFSLDKIGTGEGAQAYGHGLYFADSEDVANSYRRALASGEDPRQAVTFRGQEMPDTMPTTPVEQLAMYMRQQGYTPEDAFERARRTFTPEMMRGIDGLKPEDFAVSMPEKYNGPGRMYEVQINADPNDFLDSDTILKKQPESIRAALDPALEAIRSARMNEYDRKEILSGKATGAQLYGALSNVMPGGSSFDRAANATSTLRDAGIPGIRYLDAGSRGAGDGSRNYVVFDDKLIEILRKYGLAGAVPMGALLGQQQDPMGSYLEAQ